MDTDMITWLHLSDLHLRHSYDADVVIQKLLEDISKFIIDNSFKLDFIILSGDVSYSSKPEEYELVAKFLDKLLEVTKLNKNRLFLVPGNHDIDRVAISPGSQYISENLTDRDVINKLLANDVDRPFILKRFHQYGQFIREYMEGNIVFDDNSYYYVKIIDVNSSKVAILGLNSAWLSASDNDQGKLALGEIQIRRALEDGKEADIHVAVMHHPFDWLRGFDKREMESMLNKNCEFILHGHLHEPSLNQIHAPGRVSTIIAAGACYETRQTHNSYNFVQINLANCQSTIFFRTYSDKDGGFWTKDTLIYSDVPDGKYTFSLPDTICKSFSKPNENLPVSHGIRSINGQIGIPLIPQPYFAHFFHLHSNFTGRAEELKAIYDWFNDKKDSIMVLTAIGGMGKSSLTWYWLKECMDSSLIEGILWWSFYEGESSFSKFLNDAIIYSSRKEIDPRDIGSNYEKTRVLVNLLQEHKFLLILDGFERQLGTYENQKDGFTVNGGLEMPNYGGIKVLKPINTCLFFS